MRPLKDRRSDVRCRCILYCNLAGALLAQDKLQQAQALLTQVGPLHPTLAGTRRHLTHPTDVPKALEAVPSATPALMALTYLELRTGNVEAALQVWAGYSR